MHFRLDIAVILNAISLGRHRITSSRDAANLVERIRRSPPRRRRPGNHVSDRDRGGRKSGDV